MKSGKVRVGVFVGYIPTYRDAVFELLSKSSEFDFEFIDCGSSESDSIKLTSATSYRRIISPRYQLLMPLLRNELSFFPAELWAVIRRQYDVVIVRNDILDISAWVDCLLSRFIDVPVCIWGQGLSRPATSLRDGLRSALTRLASAALYYTEGGRDYWTTRGIAAEKLFVAYNALDTEKQNKIRKEYSGSRKISFAHQHQLTGRKVIVFLGRLVPEKGPRFFLEVLERAKRSVPSLLGILIGDGPERESLEKISAERGLMDHVRFVGALYEEEEIAGYLCNTIAVLLPTFAGLAIQHAAVYGVPVILGDKHYSHGPEAELVIDGQTGCYCRNADADAFAACIARLSSDSSYRDQLGYNLQRMVNTKYNLQMMANGFLDAVRYSLNHRA